MNAEQYHTTYTLIHLTEQEFRLIFERYYSTLCAFAHRYVEDHDAADDIVQDAFVKLWQIRKDFIYLHQVKAFLYTTVHNKALNELEHSRVISDYSHRIREKEKESFFHDTVVEQETYRILLEAIEKLPAQSKAIMRLALQEKSNGEIAKLLDISPETVHTLKKIAYKKLRIYLKNYYYLINLFCI